MKKIIVCIAFMTLALGSYAQKKTAIELNGNWKFNKGDNRKWAKARVNTENWDDRVVPVWDWDQGYQGYGWFRKEVVLPEKEVYFFNVGQADDDCEVYFNGEQLKLYISVKPGNDNADTSQWGQWKKYRSYYIPAKLVNTTKKNSIAIRVWNTLGGEGGIRYGRMFIGNTVFYNQLPVELQGNWLKTDGSNEWLIGFYNNKVAYKGKVWNYGAIKKEAEGLNITLVDGQQTETVFAKAGESTASYVIGPDKTNAQLCSLTETNKPITGEGKAQSYTPTDTLSGVAQFSGYIKDFVPARGIDGVIELHGPYNTPTYERKLPVNADGTFSISIPVKGPQTLTLRLPGISESIPAYLAPGKKTFMSVDPEEFKIRVTNEYYNRDRPTLYMGDVVLENKLILQMNWLNSLVDNDKKIWDKFMYTAGQYAAEGHVNNQLNDISAYIALNYKKYSDTGALKNAKIWSARTLMAAPGNHTFNSTFNVILQNLGEHLEGLQYLVKALQLAEKNNNTEWISAYKQQIKQAVADMIKN